MGLGISKEGVVGVGYAFVGTGISSGKVKPTKSMSGSPHPENEHSLFSRSCLAMVRFGMVNSGGSVWTSSEWIPSTPRASVRVVSGRGFWGSSPAEMSRSFGILSLST